MNRYVACLLPALFLVVACDETPPPEPEVTMSTSVQLLGAADLAPVVDVALLLVDPATGTPVTPPVVTDDQGLAFVDDVDADRLRWFVIPDQGWIPVHPPLEAVIVSDEEKTSIAASPILVLRSTSGLPSRIAGTILDDMTGEPLEGVAIGTPGWSDGWDGLHHAGGGISDGAGAFAVSGMLFALDPEEGVTIQAQPLIFQKSGYAPRAMRFQPWPGFGHEEITGVVVRLSPLNDGDTGALGGRVIYRREPVADVAVTATWMGEADKGWLAYPGVVTRTDADGRYVLDGLAPGSWFIEAGFEPDDGWLTLPFQVGPGFPLPTDVAAGDTTAVDDLVVIAALTPISPEPYWETVGPTPLFTWTSIADADSFDVFIGRGYYGRFAEPFLQLPEEYPLTQGTWSWHVEATSSEGELVAAFESRWLFGVVDR